MCSPAHAWCTLGGRIGNNSCGGHSIAGGLTADTVEEMDVLTADGLRRCAHHFAESVSRGLGGER